MNYKVLIIEDEKPAARRLKAMVAKLTDTIEVIDVIDSVEDAVTWFKTYAHPNLIFMDIQLADGLSFSIFEKIKIEVPVIFTTAYDEYAIKAFKVNSIDYLLKPIEQTSLITAWQKFKTLNSNNGLAISDLLKVINQKNTIKFKKRFLIKLGDNYTYCNIDDAAYFMSDAGFTYLVTWQNKSYIIDDKLEELETLLNPNDFFRINRKFIIHLDGIKKISSYFNSRLILQIKPTPKEDVIVARDRVGNFKSWLNQ